MIYMKNHYYTNIETLALILKICILLDGSF